MKPLDGVRDVERLAGRAAAGRATPRELGALRDSFLRLPAIRVELEGLCEESDRRTGEQSAGPPVLPFALTELLAELDLLADLAGSLVAALADRPPALLAEP